MQLIIEISVINQHLREYSTPGEVCVVQSYHPSHYYIAIYSAKTDQFITFEFSTWIPKMTF